MDINGITAARSDIPPSAPINGSAMAISPLGIHYTWDPPTLEGSAPITSYLISVSYVGGETQMHSLKASATSYDITNLLLGVSYEATIKATNDSGISYGSEFVFSSIQPIVFPPSAPPSGGDMIMGVLKLMFAWQAPEDNGGAPITTYFFTLTPNGGETQTFTFDANTTYYQTETLIDGISLQATVKASNDNGQTYSPEFVFNPVMPIVPPPAPPASATASVVSSGVVEITWEAASIEPYDQCCYYVVMSQSFNPSDPSVGLQTQDLTQLSCELSGLKPMSDYFFKVSIVNGAGRSEPAQTNTITFLN